MKKYILMIACVLGIAGSAQAEPSRGAVAAFIASAVAIYLRAANETAILAYSQSIRQTPAMPPVAPSALVGYLAEVSGGGSTDIELAYGLFVATLFYGIVVEDWLSSIQNLKIIR